MIVLMAMIVARSPTVHWACPPSNTGQLAASSGPNQDSSILILTAWTSPDYSRISAHIQCFTSQQKLYYSNIRPWVPAVKLNNIQNHRTQFMVFAKNCNDWLRPSLIIQEVDKFALTLSVWHLWPGEFCCLMLLIQYVVLYLWSLHLFTVFRYPSVSLSSSLELSIWRAFSKPHQILPIPTSSAGNKFGDILQEYLS
jgi:hypothetical protein